MAPDTLSLSVVFGAEWRPLQAAEPGQEDAGAAALCRAGGGSHYAIVEAHGESQVGWIRGRFAPGARLAGQLLASVAGAQEICFLDAVDTPVPNPFRAVTLLFVGVQSAERTVTVAVLNGTPVFEAVGKLDDVLARAHEFADKLHNGGLLLVQKDIEEQCESLRRAVPAGFRCVGALPFDVRWETRTGALRTSGFSRRALALGAAAALGTAVPGYFFHRQWARRRLVEEGDALARAKLENGVTAFERLQREAFGQSALARADAAAQMVFDFARQLLDSRAGFRVTRLLVTPKETVAHYARTDRRKTFSDFVAQSDDSTPAFDVAKLDEIRAIYGPLSWEKVPTVDPFAPINGAGVVLDLGTLAQRVEPVGVKLFLTAPQPALNPEQLARVDAASLLRIGRKSGTWTATGPVDLFAPVCEALPSGACTLLEAEFQLAQTDAGEPMDTFRASGRYFVGWS